MFTSTSETNEDDTPSAGDSASGSAPNNRKKNRRGYEERKKEMNKSGKKGGNIKGGKGNAKKDDDAEEDFGEHRYTFDPAGLTIDLRREAVFWEIIQTALVGTDSSATKYAIYILKRVVDFSQRYHTLIVSDSDQSAGRWSKYFEWSPDLSAIYGSLWDDFFLFFEIVQEAQVHLVKPILPKLTTLLLPRTATPTSSNAAKSQKNAPSSSPPSKPNSATQPKQAQLDPSWYLLLLTRSYQSVNTPIRKRCLEHTLSFGGEVEGVWRIDEYAGEKTVAGKKNGKDGGKGTGEYSEIVRVMARLLASRREFLFDILLPTLDQSYLYSVPSFGEFVSPFGELSRSFFKMILMEGFEGIDATSADKGRAELIRALIACSSTFATPVATLFVLQGLVDFGDESLVKSANGAVDGSCLVPALGAKELEAMRSLLEGERAVAVWSKLDARRLLRKLGLSILMRFLDASAVTLDDIFATISTFVSEDPCAFMSAEFRALQIWIRRHYANPEGDGLAFWRQSIGQKLNVYLSVGANESVTALESVRRTATILSRASIFLIPPTTTQRDAATPPVSTLPSSLEDCFSPLFDRLKTIHSHPYMPPALKPRCIVLLDRVLMEVGRCVSGQGVTDAVAQIFPNISQCADDVFSHLESQFLAQPHGMYE
ncbi:Tar (HIV-1) RNA binding protein 1, partial [Quaeritorhiza haematococci]